MPLCFLTGVQFSLDDAYVMNRREAFRLVNRFEVRARSLRRIIEQFLPPDGAPGDPEGPWPMAGPPRRIASFARPLPMRSGAVFRRAGTGLWIRE